jgi:hypothetical protein
VNFNMEFPECQSEHTQVFEILRYSQREEVSQVFSAASCLLSTDEELRLNEFYSHPECGSWVLCSLCGNEQLTVCESRLYLVSNIYLFIRHIE